MYLLISNLVVVEKNHIKSNMHFKNKTIPVVFLYR